MPVHARRRVALAVAGATAVLLGCPFAQPVPGIGSSRDGGTLTPPRVVVSSAHPSSTVVAYETGTCPDGGAPQFTVQAEAADEKIDEAVVVRWFVDYDPSNQQRSQFFQPYTSPAPTDPSVFVRTDIPPFSFRPLDWSQGAASVHVLEMVIANQFGPDDPATPNRTPVEGAETQFFRWVFVPTPGSGAVGGCGP